MENKVKYPLLRVLLITFLSALIAIVAFLDILMGGLFVMSLFPSETEKPDYTKVEYSAEFYCPIEVLSKEFAVKEIYSKSVTKDAGDSSAFDYVQAFIVTDEESIKALLGKYEFERPGDGYLAFPDGVSPEVTGFNTFEWYHSSDFCKKLMADKCEGHYCIDKRNNIIYFAK